MLHPILEDDEIKCPHNGVVKLKSNKGKPFKSKGIPMVLESDLLNSSIQGCTNPLLSGGPCTMVATILPNARGLKKFNDDYPIMQDLVSSGVMSDKGFPLTCTPKENTFRINSPNPSNANTQSKEALSSQIDITIPSLTLIAPYRDLEEYYFTPSTYENRESKEQYISSQSGFYTPNDTLDIALPALLKNTDYATLDSNTPLAPLLQELSDTYTPTFFSYRILSLRVAYSIYEYLLLIPKTMPRFITQLLKDKRDKEELGYGYGRFIDLGRDYANCADASYASLKYALYLIFGILIVLLLSGCSLISFKSIDPQYYKFKRLCKEAKNVIYDEKLYRIYKARYNKERYYDDKTQKEYLMSDFTITKTHIVNISDRLTINENTIFYKNIPFYKYSSFWYDYTGLFLQGDEAAGFSWGTKGTLYCKDNLIEVRR
ncbi:hypothetical protein [Helicobacter bilis]|uniref:hypothetical protein n=2 Tax=Helicobacter bilis TaxID=37372 RepID=UPI002A8243D6|nr:hypothetical protein [Helicobacter bilis]MDY4399254.1 hypothetical protein [Helicobacter bilis]